MRVFEIQRLSLGQRYQIGYYTQHFAAILTHYRYTPNFHARETSSWDCHLSLPPVGGQLRPVTVVGVGATQREAFRKARKAFLELRRMVSDLPLRAL